MENRKVNKCIIAEKGHYLLVRLDLLNLYASVGMLEQAKLIAFDYARKLSEYLQAQNRKVRLEENKQEFKKFVSEQK
jgi:hypothetical protein